MHFQSYGILQTSDFVSLNDNTGVFVYMHVCSMQGVFGCVNCVYVF